MQKFYLRILYATIIDGPIIVGDIFPIYYVFNFNLILLQIMHIIWFYMIMRMAYKTIFAGKLIKDDRSLSDIDEDQIPLLEEDQKNK